MAAFGSRFRSLEEEEEAPRLTDNEDEVEILEKAELGEESEDEGFDSESEDFAKGIHEWIEVSERKLKQEDAEKGRSVTCFECPHPNPQLASLRDIRIETARGVEYVEEWGQLDMAVDSGASATVIGENMARAVEAKNPRPDTKYGVADGTHISNLGEKAFGACTDD